MLREELASSSWFPVGQFANSLWKLFSIPKRQLALFQMIPIPNPKRAIGFVPIDNPT
jgi:hypothetical protein